MIFDVLQRAWWKQQLLKYHELISSVSTRNAPLRWQNHTQNTHDPWLVPHAQISYVGADHAALWFCAGNGDIHILPLQPHLHFWVLRPFHQNNFYSSEQLSSLQEFQWNINLSIFWDILEFSWRCWVDLGCVRKGGWRGRKNKLVAQERFSVSTDIGGQDKAMQL